MIARRAACSLVVLGLAATACAGADPGTIKGAIEERKQAGKTQAIRPPPLPDPERTGRVGLQLSTNSEGWRTALDTPDAEGAVVLLVYPRSPAERAGFVRGDVITHVGGSTIRNDERALVALRGRPGIPLHVTVERGTGPAELEVTPGPPIEADFAKLVDGLLAKSPGDPTNLLLRAQASEDTRDAITYVNRAIDLEPDFVDGLVYRARLFWAESLQISNEAIIQEDRRRAADDYRRALEIDPDATSALRSRANGQLEIREWDAAERDGLRAIGIDETLPGAYYIVAAARYSIGRMRDAAAPAREAITLDPYDANSYRLLALIFLALDRRADAEETVRVGLTVATDENQRAALRAVVE